MIETPHPAGHGAPISAPESAPLDLAEPDQARPVTMGEAWQAMFAGRDYHAICLAGAGADAPREIVARRQRQIDIFDAVLRLIERCRTSRVIVQELAAIARAEKAAAEIDESDQESE